MTTAMGDDNNDVNGDGAMGNEVGDDVESSGPSRLAATAEASTRLPSGDVEAGAVFELGSYCRVGL